MPKKSSKKPTRQAAKTRPVSNVPSKQGPETVVVAGQKITRPKGYQRRIRV